MSDADLGDYHLEQSRDWLSNALRRNDCVTKVETVGRFSIRITRKYGDEIVIRVAGNYVLGECEFEDYLSGGTNCVVLGSSWLGYTASAKTTSVKKKTGLFSFAELFGALNRKNRFWEYKPKKKKEEA